MMSLHQNLPITKKTSRTMSHPFLVGYPSIIQSKPTPSGVFSVNTTIIYYFSDHSTNQVAILDPISSTSASTINFRVFFKIHPKLTTSERPWNDLDLSHSCLSLNFPSFSELFSHSPLSIEQTEQ